MNKNDRFTRDGFIRLPTRFELDKRPEPFELDLEFTGYAVFTIAFWIFGFWATFVHVPGWQMMSKEYWIAKEQKAAMQRAGKAAMQNAAMQNKDFTFCTVQKANKQER